MRTYYKNFHSHEVRGSTTFTKAVFSVNNVLRMDALWPSAFCAFTEGQNQFVAYKVQDSAGHVDLHIWMVK